MVKSLMIADDFSHAQEVGAILMRLNYRTHTLMEIELLDPICMEENDCMLIPKTKYLTEQDSKEYCFLKNIVLTISTNRVSIFSMQMNVLDISMLRLQTSCLLDILGEDYMSIVVPYSEKDCIGLCGGYLLKEGTPTTRLSDYFIKDGSTRVDEIKLDEVWKGKEWMAQCIQKKRREGVRVLIIDCMSKEQLTEITNAVIFSGIHCLCIDPGDFTTLMIRKLMQPVTLEDKHPSIVLLEGSDSWIQGQVNSLAEHMEIYEFQMDWKLRTNPEEIVSRIQGSTSYPEAIVMRKKINESDNDERQENLPRKEKTFDQWIARVLFELFRRDQSIEGLVTNASGVIQELCKINQSASLELREEILDGAIYERMWKGRIQRLRIVHVYNQEAGEEITWKSVTYLQHKSIRKVTIFPKLRKS